MLSGFPPEILEPPQNQTVIEGELARFPCKMTGAPEPQLSWYRGMDGKQYKILEPIVSIKLWR